MHVTSHILIDLTGNDNIMDFTTPVQQSPALQNTGLSAPLPLADADLLQPATKRARRLEAEQYLMQVRSKFVAGDAEPADVDAAELYRSQVFLAESLSSIQRNIAPISAADVAAALLGPINARFRQLWAMQTNRFATRLTDSIVPLPTVPSVGSTASTPALPSCFPATRQDLMDLTGTQLTVLLQYYNEPTDGSVDDCRNRLIAFLGMPPTR